MASRKRIRTRTSRIYCVEKDYGGEHGTMVIGCYSHKADAQKVVSANRGMTLLTKKLIRRVVGR